MGDGEADPHKIPALPKCGARSSSSASSRAIRDGGTPRPSPARSASATRATTTRRESAPSSRSVARRSRGDERVRGSSRRNPRPRSHALPRRPLRHHEHLKCLLHQLLAQFPLLFDELLTTPLPLFSSRLALLLVEVLIPGFSTGFPGETGVPAPPISCGPFVSLLWPPPSCRYAASKLRPGPRSRYVQKQA